MGPNKPLVVSFAKGLGIDRHTAAKYPGLKAGVM
jgi:hypothetical protein